MVGAGLAVAGAGGGAGVIRSKTSMQMKNAATARAPTHKALRTLFRVGLRIARIKRALCLPTGMGTGAVGDGGPLP